MISDYKSHHDPLLYNCEIHETHKLFVWARLENDIFSGKPKFVFNSYNKSYFFLVFI